MVTKPEELSLTTRRQKYRRNAEMEYVSDFLARFYPHAITWEHVMLGRYPIDEDGRKLSYNKQHAMGIMRRWADGIAVETDKITLIEGKLIPARYLEGAGKLRLYARLVLETPELKEHRDKPIEMMLLVPIEDHEVRLLCMDDNITFKVWCPDFIDKYFEVVPPAIVRHWVAEKKAHQAQQKRW